MELDTSLDRARDAHVLPVVDLIYKELAALPDLKMGMPPEGVSVDEFKTAKAELYKDVSFRIIKAMLENGVKYSELQYLFMAAKEPVDTIREMCQSIIDVKYDEALSQFYGVEDTTEISVSQIEQQLVDYKNSREA